MNITNILQNRAYIAQNTKSAIYSLADYVSGQLESLSSFMSGEKPDGYVSLPAERDSTGAILNRVVLVDYSSVENAMADDSAVITGLMSDSGETVTLSGKEVYDRLSETVQDLKTQQCFLRYCLESVEATADGFLSRISAITDGIPGYLKEKYSQFLSNGGNAINAISSFLSTRLNTPEKMDDQYISVTNFEDFSGNVWEAVWTKIVTDVQHCFEDVIWKGITHIGEFLSSIWDGIAKLVKWGLSTLFGDLFTSFEQTSKSVQGIIDLPMFQLDLGEITMISGTNRPYLDKLWGLLYSIKSGDRTSYDAYSGYYNIKWNMTDIFTANQGFETAVMESIIDLCLAYDQDGLGVKSICDIPIPLDDPYFDFCLRFGFESSGHVIMSGFYVCSGGNIKDVATTDSELFKYLGKLCSKVTSTITKTVPMLWSDPYYEDWSFRLVDVGASFLPYINTSAETVDEEDFLNSIKYKFTDINDSSILTNSGRAKAVLALVLYACINAKGFHTLRVNNEGKIMRNTDVTNNYLQILYNQNMYYEPNPGTLYPATVEILDNVGLDLTLYNKDTYKPYMVRDVFPVVMHFQTISERATEIVNALRAVLIVAVAVFITVKIVKTKRSFARKMIEYTAAQDQSAWDLAADPNNSAKRALFNKNFNKVRRMNLLGRVIGVTSEAVASESISSFNITKSDADISSISRLIKG